MPYIINPKIKYEDMKFDIGDYAAERLYNKKCKTNLKLINDGSITKGNCFNYATKNYYLEFCEDALEYINSNYKEVDIADIKIRDIIVFFEDWNDEICNEDNIQHFAKIVRTDNTISGTIIRSKWGQDGIFEGNINDLPDIYGDTVKFYTKKTLKSSLKRLIKRNIF